MSENLTLGGCKILKSNGVSGYSLADILVNFFQNRTWRGQGAGVGKGTGWWLQWGWVAPPPRTVNRHTSEQAGAGIGVLLGRRQDRGRAGTGTLGSVKMFYRSIIISYLTRRNRDVQFVIPLCISFSFFALCCSRTTNICN